MTDPDPDIIMTDTPAPRGSPWSQSSRQPRLPSSELSKQRVLLRHKGKVYHACPKTANKRGGTSWTWDYGTELRRTNTKKPDWLCNLCWDKRETFIHGTTSIPAMSAETERTFSQTKHTISPTRTCLGADIVEAEECLHAWYKAGI